MKNKTTNINNPKKKIEKLKKQKIVITSGCFDIIHPGHIHLLKKSKSLGDILIVCIHGDKSPYFQKKHRKPILCEKDRAEHLAAFEFVDFVIIFQKIGPIEIFKQIKPDIYTKGTDYNLSKLHKSEKETIKNLNIKVKFIPLKDKKKYSSGVIAKELMKDL